MKKEFISKLVEKVSQCRPADVYSESFTYIDISCIDAMRKEIVDPSVIAIADAPSRARQLTRAHDVLVSTVRPNLNAVAEVPENYDKAISSTGFCVLRPNQTVLHSRYLFYFCRHNSFVEHLTKMATGASYPAVTEAQIVEIKIPLPTLEEQQRLAYILDCADKQWRLRSSAVEQTEQMVASAFLEICGNPIRNNMNWPVRVVEDLLSTDRPGTKCGPFGSALKRHEYVQEGVPVWGVENVQFNRFVEEGSLFIEPEKYRQLSAYQVSRGDILITRAGTVGRMCVANPSVKDSIIGTNLIKVSLNEELIFPEYFCTLMSYFPGIVNTLRASADDTAYSFMNTSTIEALEIPLPPKKTQMRFAAVVKSLDGIQKRNREAQRQAKLLFDSLLDGSFITSARTAVRDNLVVR